MDPITHALSGAVCAQILPPQVRSWRVSLWAALVAASPDVDVFFIRSPLQYIEWHRGITHSFVGAAVLALFTAWALIWGLSREAPVADARAARHGWTWKQAWIFSYFLIMLHVWLDVATSYGTQVLLPFSDFRVRFSGLFIIDLLTILPLAVGLLFFAKKRRVMVGLLIWTLAFPAAANLSRVYLEDRFAEVLPKTFNGYTVDSVSLSPDAFAPLYWMLFVSAGPNWYMDAPVTPAAAFESAPLTFTAYPKPPEALWNKWQDDSPAFRAYAHFVQFPYLEASYSLEELPTGKEEGPRLPVGEGKYRVDIFNDLRFESGLALMRCVLGPEQSSDGKSFRLATLSEGGELLMIRFKVVPAAGGDSGWEGAN